MKSSMLLLVGLLGIVGCSTAMPSPELVNARQAYERARTSQAAQAAPDSLVSAKQALDKAEEAFNEDAGSAEERTYAYVAERRSMRAIAEGNERIAKQVKVAADQQYVALQSEMRQDAEKQLEQASGVVSEMEQKNAAADSAIQSLARLAQVKEDPRGIVVTISGGTLFATGSSKIMPSAHERLNEVARALSQQGQGRSITVEGYTDSRGGEDMNQKLSQERADAVRDYLVKQGVEPGKISAVGNGEANPIASNDTSDGRAANRRVEIVVARPSSGGMEQPSSPRGTPTQ